MSAPSRARQPLLQSLGRRRSCRPHRLRRPFSSAVPPAPPCAGIARLRSRRVLQLSGPDAAKYLQSAITANLLATTTTAPTASSATARPTGTNNSHYNVRADGFYAGFLTAQGRIRHDVFVHPVATADPSPTSGASTFFIDVDADHAAALARLIGRYRLRAGFAVTLLDEDSASVWQAWDDGGGAGHDTLHKLARERGSSDAIVAVDSRAPNLGFRILHLSSSPAARASPFLPNLEPATETAFRIRRILHGVPEGQRELPAEASLPLEANMDVMGAIDFRKGCYVGQELTIRTKHRGVVRKRVLPCMLYGEGVAAGGPPAELVYDPSRARGLAAAGGAGMPPAGADIGRVGSPSRRTAAGRWLGGVGNIGLALCRVEAMTDLAPLPGEAGVFDPAQEFEIAGGGGGGRRLGVRAFVPGWMRAALAASAASAGG